MSAILSALADLWRIRTKRTMPNPVGYAFLIHPRYVSDAYIKYPLLKFLPETVVLWLSQTLWPITMSEITGLKDTKTGRDIPGWVISIPMNAKQILENREAALQQLRKAVILAKSRGAKFVGLGALLASISRGGQDLLDLDVFITTGHAYTIYNVVETLVSIAKELKRNLRDCTVAIVGASGSIGSGSARLLADHNPKKLLLIDLFRKSDKLDELLQDLKAHDPNLQIQLSHRLDDIRTADFVITATNSPEALIRADDLKSGAVVVDDAQPTDVDDSVFDRDDVLVLEAGAVRTPGISTHLRLGLLHPNDNFACLAELLILVATSNKSHFAVGRATREQVREIASKGSLLNFTNAAFQNEREPISYEKIERVARAWHRS